MSNTSDQSKTPLDDVMIAMDVVDTLRHDRKLVEQELNDEGRRRELIDRLRKIYHGQGIDVPDKVLEEGVRALEEDRFTYKAPDDDLLTTKLARLYVSRWKWGRYVLGIAGALLAYWCINYFVFERPRQQQVVAERIELETRLPASLRKLAADIKSEAKDEKVAAKASEILTAGLNAASSSDLAAARKNEGQLKELLTQLRGEFEVRIVNRKGQVSGLWRIPKVNPDALNYYLVVEAVSSKGETLAQWITNEETSKREKVKVWAVRVSRAVLDEVRKDKEDDGIIQKAVVGRKSRGELEPRWDIPVAGGAITKWD